MKNFLITLSFAICLTTFTSCSVDEIDQSERSSELELRKLKELKVLEIQRNSVTSRDSLGKEGDDEVIDPIIKPKKD